ncbi:MAG TPA: anaerobic ribonucleoside-triphosphate reductase activating protein [Candidatus Cloacimonadota bacterium]|nr:anaerobic ribonucleoside-triphosphate reductase activating protein [Candidatus Cloacimonadota bacterium]
MKIGGIQKFSLIEYPAKLSAIIFTRGCNFRCPYCHNPELVDPKRYRDLISETEIMKFLKSRIGKLEAVVITGGEPTLQPDLIDFAIELKHMGYYIKLDTNGSRPEVIQKLIKRNAVDYWAMDIKAPLALYPSICGCPIQEKDILTCMDLIRNSGKEWEFRTTYFNQVLNQKDIASIQTLLKPGDRYYIQKCKYDNTLLPMQEPLQNDWGELFKQKQRGAENSEVQQTDREKDRSDLPPIIIKLR